MRKSAALLIAALAALAYAGYRFNQAREDHARHDQREAALRQTLAQMRAAIDRFHEEKQRSPRSLEELVPNYLRSIPADPMTGSNKTWRFSTEETVLPSADFTTDTAPKSETYILDVHSGAGAPYSDW